MSAPNFLKISILSILLSCLPCTSFASTSCENAKKLRDEVYHSTGDLVPVNEAISRCNKEVSIWKRLSNDFEQCKERVLKEIQDARDIADEKVADNCGQKVEYKSLNKPAKENISYSGSIGPRTISHFPTAEDRGREASDGNYYLNKRLQTTASLPEVRSWYVQEAKKKSLPLVSQKEEKPIISSAMKRFNLRENKSLFLFFVNDSKDKATIKKPYIVIKLQEVEENGQKYTYIDYQFWANK